MTRKTMERPALALTCLTLMWQAQVFAAPQLEEVIVTAEKREESLQDVPISIAAFSEDKLEKLGITDIKALASNVPNVVVSEFTGAATSIRLFMRGVGQNDVQVTQDPSVALYMDGVYIGSSVGTAFESADMQRIEVLRGPQGTLYGRNATGGAINLITRKADPERLNFRQTLTAGNYDLFRSRTILNVPLGDTTAIKLAYSTMERDGVVDNLGKGEDWGKEDKDNLTADFHWSINDASTLDYKYEQSNIKDTSRLSQVLHFDADAPRAGIISFENPAVDGNGKPVESGNDRLEKATAYDEEVDGDIEIIAHTLTYALDIGDTMTFKSITGYREFEALNQTAQSPTTSLLGSYTITNGISETDFEQLSQEFHLLGNTESITWVGGLYYYEDESDYWNFGDSNGSEGIPEGELVDFTSTDNTSLALYGQATWSPTQLEDRWHFSLGLRYSEDNRKAFRDNNRISYRFGGAPGPVPAFTDNYDQDFDSFNPAFTVEYDLDDRSRLYAKVATAYKSGGTSQRSTNSTSFQNGFDQEDLTSYELGYKADLLDRRLRVNGALFYMDFEGYQQSVQTGLSPGERDFINIDEATIAGLELDISMAINDAWTVSASYGYLDSEFGPDRVSYLRIDDSAPGGITEVTEPLTDDLAMAPEHSATISVDYNRALSFGIFDANLNYQYRDEALAGVQAPTGIIGDHQLLVATLSLSEIAVGSGQLKFRLWGKNLLDEEYHVGNIRQGSFDDLGLIGLATFGDPRTYGLTIEYEYF
jgi:iron complex outermembrane receptor protein